MKTLRVLFSSGRELLGSYWAFLRHGGVVLRDTDLCEGDRVVLHIQVSSLKRAYAMTGRVVRRAPVDGRAFIAFEEGQDQDLMMNAAWADSHEVPQRKHRRRLVESAVSYAALRGQGDAGQGRLLDLGPGGCRIKGTRALPAGTRLTVRALGTELEGQVRWVTPGGEMGVEFARPDLVAQALGELRS